MNINAGVDMMRIQRLEYQNISRSFAFQLEPHCNEGHLERFQFTVNESAMVNDSSQKLFEKFFRSKDQLYLEFLDFVISKKINFSKTLKIRNLRTFFRHTKYFTNDQKHCLWKNFMIDFAAFLVKLISIWAEDVPFCIYTHLITSSTSQT